MRQINETLLAEESVENLSYLNECAKQKEEKSLSYMEHDTGFQKCGRKSTHLVTLDLQCHCVFLFNGRVSDGRERFAAVLF